MGIQWYASHRQLYNICSVIRRDLEALWHRGGTVHELIITMNGYDLEGHFLDYVFQKVIAFMCELQAYILISQDIFSVTRDSRPSFIENIKKELETTGRSLPFVTSESAHEIVEKCLGEDEAFRFVVECSLTTDQPTHFNDEPSNDEETAA